jgi:hypothetical protein
LKSQQKWDETSFSDTSLRTSEGGLLYDETWKYCDVLQSPNWRACKCTFFF